MKKNLKMIIIPLMVFMFMPFSVFASSFKINVACPAEVQIGKTAECQIKGTVTGGEISSLSAKFSVTGNAESLGFKTASGWQGSANGSKIDLYTDSNKSGTFNIGTITVKGKQAGTASVNISEVFGYDADFIDFDTSSGSAKSFKVVAPTTKPTTTKKPTTTTKRPTTTSRTTTTRPGHTTTSRVIPTKPTTTDPSDRTTTTTTTTGSMGPIGPGNQPTTTKYIPPTNGKPFKLTSVTVDDFKVVFRNDVYYVTVRSDTESVNIFATATEGVTVYGTGPRTLAYGKNLVELVLRGPNNQSAMYQVVITRPTDDGVYYTNLLDLKVVGYDIDFNPEIYEYSVSVPFNAKELYVMATAHEDTIVTGDGLYNIKKRDNKIYVMVSYGDLQTTEYVITVKKSYFMVILYVVIGTLSIGLIAAISYAYMSKKKLTESFVSSKNKIIAEAKRDVTENSQSAGMMVNGERVTGVGRRMVTPIKVDSIKEQPKYPEANDFQSVQKVKLDNTPVSTIVKPIDVKPRVVTNAPEAQVKVVKTTVMPTQEEVEEELSKTGQYKNEDIVITDFK